MFLKRRDVLRLMGALSLRRAISPLGLSLPSAVFLQGAARGQMLEAIAIGLQVANAMGLFGRATSGMAQRVQALQLLSETILHNQAEILQILGMVSNQLEQLENVIVQEQRAALRDERFLALLISIDNTEHALATTLDEKGSIDARYHTFYYENRFFPAVKNVYSVVSEFETVLRTSDTGIRGVLSCLIAGEIAYKIARVIAMCLLEEQTYPQEMTRRVMSFETLMRRAISLYLNAVDTLLEKRIPEAVGEQRALRSAANSRLMSTNEFYSNLISDVWGLRQLGDEGEFEVNLRLWMLERLSIPNLERHPWEYVGEARRIVYTLRGHWHRVSLVPHIPAQSTVVRLLDSDVRSSIEKIQTRKFPEPPDGYLAIGDWVSATNFPGSPAVAIPKSRSYRFPDMMRWTREAHERFEIGLLDYSAATLYMTALAELRGAAENIREYISTIWDVFNTSSNGGNADLGEEIYAWCELSTQGVIYHTYAFTGHDVVPEVVRTSLEKWISGFLEARETGVATCFVYGSVQELQADFYKRLTSVRLSGGSRKRVHPLDWYPTGTRRLGFPNELN